MESTYDVYRNMDIVVLVVVLCGMIAWLIWASSCIDSQVYMDTICRGEDAKRTLCLTFDDGPDAIQTPAMLDLLKEQNVHACFFLVGSKIKGNEDLVRRIYEEGHTIGLHGYTHRWWAPCMGKKRILKDYHHVQSLLYNVLGVKPRFVRPPYGVTNPWIGMAAKKLQLVGVGWSIRSFDTMHPKRWQRIVQRITQRLHAGGIILLHERCKYSVQITRNVIQQAHNNGYEFEDMEVMTHEVPYEKE